MIAPEPLFIVSHMMHGYIGYFEDGYCRRLASQTSNEMTFNTPHARWWMGKWDIICVGPIEDGTGQWEHDHPATKKYSQYIAGLIVN